MINKENSEDIAGKGYWDDTWKTSEIPQIINPQDKSISNVIECTLNIFFHKIFDKYLPETKDIQFIEVGCGNSAFLSYMNKEFGFHVAGLDYSEIGCEMTRKAMAYYNVNAEIYLCDLFNPADNLRKKYDIVFAAGVIEHFTDTHKPCEAMLELAKSGGYVINIIPNFSPGSVMGKLQKKYAPDIYEKHVPLDRTGLIKAHEEVGLETLYCNYLLAYNYGVLNFGGKYEWIQKFYIRMGKLKMLFTKNKIVGTQKNAPYIVYIGRLHENN